MMWRMKKWFMKNGCKRVSGEISDRQGKRKIYMRFSGGFKVWMDSARALMRNFGRRCSIMPPSTLRTTSALLSR